MSEMPEKTLFPAGEKFESEWFNKTVWLHPLVPSGAALPVYNVTFEPGCRNNWHKHQGGQILLVTNGRGYYQAWGEPARELCPGDVVEIPADVEHWHGAAKDSWFSHVAIEVHPEKGPATWLKPVDDETYDALD